MFPFFEILMTFEFAMLAAFGAMLCWGFGDFFIQRTTRKIGDVESLAMIGIIGTIGLFPFVMSSLSLLSSPINLFILLALGTITFFVAMADFEALKRGKLCVVDVVLEIELPITVVLGLLFFGEILTAQQVIAIFVAFLGIILISLRPHSLKHMFSKFEKGVLIAIVAAVGMSFVNFLTAFSSKNISPLMAIWVPWVVCAMISLAFIGKREGVKKLASNVSKFKYMILAMGIFDTLAWLCFSLAVFGEELSITIAITESYPVIAIFLGLMINHEKIGAHQYLGAAIALGASIFLGFFS